MCVYERKRCSVLCVCERVCVSVCVCVCVCADDRSVSRIYSHLSVLYVT